MDSGISIGWVYFVLGVDTVLCQNHQRSVYHLMILTIFSQVGVLHLPLNAVWLSSLFFIIGGGPTTGTTLLTTVVADVVPAEVRSTVFFYRFCTDLVADLIVPPITSILMRKNTWIPLLLAVAFQGLSVIVALGLPETLPVVDPKRFGEDADGISSESTSSEQAEIPSKSDGRWGSWLTRNKDSFDFVIKDRALSALVFTFLISKVGRQAANMLFQYVSKRYGWTLAQVSLYSLDPLVRMPI